ncbi:MAG: hypothetical protein ABIY56_03470 [Dokdonella sp.]
MPSSTSSSSPRRWKGVWLVTLLVALGVCGGVEYHWRSLGYVAAVIDSKLLWSEQRERVYARDSRTPLVILGASRIEFSIDMPLLQEALPKYTPVMLAINGHYPLAALRDLAADGNFHGVILCDIDSRGLTAAYRDMQQPYVDYFHQRWTPSWRLHRGALTWWQHTAVIANPDFGVLPSALRWLDGHPDPWKSYVRFRADRSGDADYSKVDIAPLTKIFADNFQRRLQSDPAPPAQRWLAQLTDVQGWVGQIQARGGEVIFYNTPTAGELRQHADAAYPKDQYWDRFASMIGAPTLDYTEVSALEAIPLPDGSHLDYRDKPAYTQALVDALVQRGWLQR